MKERTTMKREPIHITDEVWRDYRSRLLGFIRARVHNKEVAEDILHDVLLKAWSQLKSLKDADNLNGWMYRIARNSIVDHYRSTKHPTLSIDAPDTIDIPSTDTANNSERELAECLRPMIEQLPDHYRRAIVLTDLTGISQTEVAKREGISISGAKSRVQRGRKMLKAMVVECCRLEFDVRGNVVEYEPKLHANVCTKC